MRLQAAQSGGMSVAWLAVMAGGVGYLLPLGQSGEIFPLANLQPVPYSKAWFLGVVNVRGSLFGVVDLARFVADDAGASDSTLANADASVITLNALLDVSEHLLQVFAVGLE